MSRSGPPAQGTRHFELLAIVLAGLVHVLLELTVSGAVAGGFSAAAAAGFLLYAVHRASRDREVLRAWGIRADNFGRAVGIQARFGAPAAAVLLGHGWATGSLPPPPGFWLTVAVYPVWALAQQFALQNLVARNLAALFPGSLPVAAVSALLFSASHVPNWPLVLPSLAGGFAFTWLHRRCPNLWATSLAHSALGALAAYTVLGADPGGRIVDELVNRL